MGIPAHITAQMARRIPRIGRALLGLDAQIQAPRLPSPLYQQRRTIFGVPPILNATAYHMQGIRSTNLPPPAGSLPSDTFDPVDELYTADGFRLTWTNYQKFLVHQLNYITSDDPEAQTMLPEQIAKQFQRDPDQATLFNYGSQAYNNHFYIKGLTHEPRPIEDYPSLKASLEQDFGSIGNLRDQMIFTGAGMFGSGYVWLVWVRGPSSVGAGSGGAGGWRVLATYNAGTPFAHHQATPDGGLGRGRLQSRDVANMTSEQVLAMQRRGEQQQHGAMTAGAFGRHSASGRAEANRRLGGPREIFPVLCVSVWQHAYIRDHGVQGKKTFLEKWWRFVNWGEVNNLAPEGSRNRFDQFGYVR